jgi:hypothetical protein
MTNRKRLGLLDHGVCERCVADISQHAAEDKLMKRKEGIPIKDPEQTHGIEDCGLSNGADAVFFGDFKFKPSATGNFHFRR